MFLNIIRLILIAFSLTAIIGLLLFCKADRNQTDNARYVSSLTVFICSSCLMVICSVVLIWSTLSIRDAEAPAPQFITKSYTGIITGFGAHDQASPIVSGEDGPITFDADNVDTSRLTASQIVTVIYHESSDGRIVESISIYIGGEK